MSNPLLHRIEVEGLYHQFNFELSLKPGLNVIFGKNGRGKTTLLHILANTLELDFPRFQHLQFKSIALSTYDGDKLLMLKVPGEHGIKLLLNDTPVGTQTPQGLELSPAERQLLRTALGSRPIYLPAFRSIIERVRSDTPYGPPTREPEVERLKEHERQAEKEGDIRSTQYGRYRDLAGVNARKTLLCREWFGQFVPAIRYPSIIEVAERLMDEYRDAQLELGYQDSRMLSEMFVNVFRALLSEEVGPTDLEVETLIRRVSHSLAPGKDKDRYGEDNAMDHLGASLTQVIEKVKDRGPHKEEAAERRVLKLYAEMLERRNQERKHVFSRFRSFEGAVNRFLEDKELRVRDDPDRARQAIALRRDGVGVYVEAEGGRRYSLTALSSGERQVLTMLFSASRLGVSQGVFLVDEPEISLHVDWQRMILRELSAQAGDRQIVVCTHAPEVGADHMGALQKFSPSRYREPSLFPTEEGAPDSQLDDLS